MKKRSFGLLLIGGILILVLALGSTAVLAQTIQDPDTTPETESESDEDSHYHHWQRRGFGFYKELRDRDFHLEQLAEELGVSVAELQGAFRSALAAAREDGILGFPGHQGSADGEYQSYLEDALAEIGLTFEELQEAQEAVKEAMMAELLDQGLVTQEQLDLAEAWRGLRDYIDRAALMTEVADALGLELPEADETFRGGFSPREFMEQLEENNLTIQDVVEATKVAFENAVNDAVSDGVIDSDQAALILEKGYQSFGGIRGGYGMHGGCQQGFGGMRGHGRTPGFGTGGYHGFRLPNGNLAPTGSSL